MDKWALAALVGLIAYAVGKNRGVAAVAGSSGETLADVPAEWWTYAGSWQ